jgi:hypothetical protein
MKAFFNSGFQSLIYSRDLIRDKQTKFLCHKRRLCSVLRIELFTNAAYMPYVHQITSKEWATIVSDAYIWMEYAFATAPPNMHSSTHPLSQICMFS